MQKLGSKTKIYKQHGENNRNLKRYSSKEKILI